MDQKKEGQKMQDEKTIKLKKFIIDNDIELEDAARAFGFSNVLYQAVKIEQLIVHYVLKSKDKNLQHNEQCLIGQALKDIRNLKDI